WNLDTARAHGAVDRRAAQIDAVAEIAGAVAAVGVARAAIANGATRILGDAARPQHARVVDGGALDLTRQAATAVDLARAAITELTGRGLTQPAVVAAKPVTALGRAFAPRHAVIVEALQLATARAVIRAW